MMTELPQESDAPQPYGLQLRQTSHGRYSIDRFRWAEFPVKGEWIKIDHRCVASNLSREGSKRWAAAYTAEHPGCRDPRKAAA
jgi:hypothetical protein